MFPNETPWPGLNYRTAHLMPGLRREFQKNDRLATHTALGELFIPDEFRKCKRVFAKLGSEYGLRPSILHFGTSTEYLCTRSRVRRRRLEYLAWQLRLMRVRP
jgi:hypothetical protein